MHKDHLRYSPPDRIRPGELQIALYDGGTRFQEIAGMETGILEANENFTSRDDPDPAGRFLWRLVLGQHIHNDDLSGDGTLGKLAGEIDRPLALIWQDEYGIRMPNLAIDLLQYIHGAAIWADLERLKYEWSDCQKYAPVGQALDGQGTGEERYADAFYEPASGEPNTLVLRARPGPGTYGIRYQEGTEATGSRNTQIKDPETGRLVFGAEAQFAESVEDVFFHAFDTTDMDNFRITTEPRFYAREYGRLAFPVGRRTTASLNLYLIPRQWFYFVYILAWYMIVTPFTMSYYPLPFVATWWDRPPVRPHAFGMGDYMAQIYGGMDDYAVYWQITHDQRFLELQSQVHDFEMSTWLMGIYWAGISDYYMRVRCFGAKERQLCAVIEDAAAGFRWYIWRKTAEEKDKITLVDCKFWPEQSAGAGGGF